MFRQGVLNELLCVFCPYYIRMHVLDTLTNVIEWGSTINHGIEFSPIIACWIFVVAAVNCSFPGFLPGYFNWKKLEAYLKMGIRVFSIWFMFHFVWVPANRAIFWLLREYLVLSTTMCQQWMPFLSVVLSIYILALSLSYSGIVRMTGQRFPWKVIWKGVNGKRQLSVPVTPSQSPRTRSALRRTTPRGSLRTTRSGAVYGTWGD